MSDELLVWTSPARDAETVRDAAERFIQEYFGTERTIRFGDSPGVFWFADGYWCYRLTYEAGHWYVRRTELLTKKAKSRARARREARRDATN